MGRRFLHHHGGMVGQVLFCSTDLLLEDRHRVFRDLACETTAPHGPRMRVVRAGHQQVRQRGGGVRVRVPACQVDQGCGVGNRVAFSGAKDSTQASSKVVDVAFTLGITPV